MDYSHPKFYYQIKIAIYLRIAAIFDLVNVVKAFNTAIPILKLYIQSLTKHNNYETIH